MHLTPELIERLKNELHLKEDFEDSEDVTASHILYNQWKDYSGKHGMPKLIFYILMDEEYGPCFRVDNENNLGRPLKLKHKSPLI